MMPVMGIFRRAGHVRDVSLVGTCSSWERLPLFGRVPDVAMPMKACILHVANTGGGTCHGLDTDGWRAARQLESAGS